MKKSWTLAKIIIFFPFIFAKLTSYFKPWIYTKYQISMVCNISFHRYSKYTRKFQNFKKLFIKKFDGCKKKKKIAYLSIIVVEGGGAALRVLECSQGFGVAPRVLEWKSEIYEKSPLKRVLLNRKFKKGLCYPFFSFIVYIFVKRFF